MRYLVTLGDGRLAGDANGTPAIGIDHAHFFEESLPAYELAKRLRAGPHPGATSVSERAYREDLADSADLRAERVLDARDITLRVPLRGPWYVGEVGRPNAGGTLYAAVNGQQRESGHTPSHDRATAERLVAGLNERKYVRFFDTSLLLRQIADRMLGYGVPRVLIHQGRNADDRDEVYTCILLAVSVCHFGPCPLDLERMLAAGREDFTHDVCGLLRHLDVETGELRDCFVPRLAARGVGE